MKKLRLRWLYFRIRLQSHKTFVQMNVRYHTKRLFFGGECGYYTFFERHPHLESFIGWLRGCEHCHYRQFGDVLYEHSRTAYHDNRNNQGAWYCRYCAEDYHEYWNEMWADYYTGRF